MPKEAWQMIIIMIIVIIIIQSLNVHGWHQTVWQKWKKIGNPNTESENTQLGHRDGIWHRKMCHAHNEKQEMIHNGRKKTTKPRENQNARRKGNLQILEINGSEDEGKN